MEASDQHARDGDRQTPDAYLLGGDGLLSAGSQILNSLGVGPQIQLATDQDDWQTVAEVQDFRDPLQDMMYRRDES